MKVQWYEYDWTVYVAGNVQASVPLAWTRCACGVIMQHHIEHTLTFSFDENPN